MKTKSILIIGAILGLLFTGCGTLTPTQQQRAVTATKIAAYVGTHEAVRQHPEWRDGFQQAVNDLGVMEASSKIDATMILAIMQRLPVKELKSPQATLAITAATILLSDYAGSVPLDQVQQLKPVVTAMREGIELGLSP